MSQGRAVLGLGLLAIGLGVTFIGAGAYRVDRNKQSGWFLILPGVCFGTCGLAAIQAYLSLFI